MSGISDTEKEHIDILYRNGAFWFVDENTSFLPYTSGMIGPVYVDSSVVVRNTWDHKKAIDGLKNMIRINLGNDFEFIVSGGESKDWIFSEPIAKEMQKYHLKLYKEKKYECLTNVKGKNVVHVADLNREGSSMRDLWAPKIKELGGNIEHTFFYVDRDELGAKVLEELGIESHALVILNNKRWKYMLDSGLINDEQYKGVIDYREDSIEWGREVLRSEEGLETIINLINSGEAGRQKAINIMEKDLYGVSETLQQGLSHYIDQTRPLTM